MPIIRHKLRPVVRPYRKNALEYIEAIVSFLQERDGDNCSLCGKPISFDRDNARYRSEGPSLHHHVPVALGGENRLTNFRLVHRGCNASEGAKYRQQTLKNKFRMTRWG